LESRAQNRQITRLDARFSGQEAPMTGDLHPAFPCGSYKPSSFIARLRGWMTARFQDLVLVANAMHRVQWAAPWDESEPPHKIADTNKS